jgi:DNA-directed RNA polymerase specialized sigma24 family protein
MADQGSDRAEHGIQPAAELLPVVYAELRRLAVDETIQKLQAEKPHLAEIAMLRFFAGLSTDETAAVLGISASTLAREWRFARAWLASRLGDAPLRAGRADE